MLPMLAEGYGGDPTRLWAVGPANYSFYIIYNFISYCLLFIIYYLFFVFRYSLLAIHWLLGTWGLTFDA